MKGATQQAATFLALIAGPLLLAPATKGASCSNYAGDAHAASLRTCKWNTYMCCWTGRYGLESVNGNADVCRVLDYPSPGNVLEMPGNSEGSVYCHGFAWPYYADPTSYALPLYYHVKNEGAEGGYYGNVEGAPECGCIEDMPMVDDAACSTYYKRDGIQPCADNSLFQEYNRALGKPKGEMYSNLVYACDNN